ncbi:hypothetical protein L4D76_26350 [Photobacterium sagamiensis]|uniref:hypothetical protein n=1 Tax=Photobacterium sagamiensis TaxID=2910241 RepID=UPI003D1305AE
MNKIHKIIALAIVVTLGQLVIGTPAYAKQPLDVDCGLLEATNDAVNDFLDGQGVQFNNIGDLVSSAIQDDAVFEQLRDLILFFSGGEIEFESASQLVSTNAKCGLVPQLIYNIRD